MNKSLQEKAVSIKGKQYVLVSDRVLYFNENYPTGSIETKLLSEPDAVRVVVRATVTIPIAVEGKEVVADRFVMDVSGRGYRSFTGHSQAVIGEGMVNKTAALENAETSAVGRALAMMGIGVIESIASVDEIRKATNTGNAVDDDF